VGDPGAAEHDHRLQASTAPQTFAQFGHFMLDFLQLRSLLPRAQIIVAEFLDDVCL
jgi:hypothetical protein